MLVDENCKKLTFLFLS